MYFGFLNAYPALFWLFASSFGCLKSARNMATLLSHMGSNRRYRFVSRSFPSLEDNFILAYLEWWNCDDQLHPGRMETWHNARRIVNHVCSG